MRRPSLGAWLQLSVVWGVGTVTPVVIRRRISLLWTILSHVALLHIPAIRPHITPLLHVAAIGFHAGVFAALYPSVGGKARVDSIGAFKILVSPASVIATIAESQRPRNWAPAPFVAMPASAHPEHALAMNHTPA